VKLLTCRVAEMIAIDLQPLSVVEDTGFIRLVAELDSSYPTVVPEIQAKTKLKDTEFLHTSA